VTSKAHADGATPRLSKPSEAKRKAAPFAGPVNVELFEALRSLRREKAEDMGVPPFVVFSDATLRDMARRLPRDRQELLAVSGVGRAKCEAFGDAFLEAIRTFTSTHGVRPAENAEAPPRPVGKRPNVQSTRRQEAQRRANELFARGASIEDVAEELNRAPSTVEEYLVDYINAEGITDAAPWIAPSLFERVREAAGLSKDGPLKLIRDALNEEASYSQIRICLACLNNAK